MDAVDGPTNVSTIAMASARSSDVPPNTHGDHGSNGFMVKSPSSDPSLDSPSVSSPTESASNPTTTPENEEDHHEKRGPEDEEEEEDATDAKGTNILGYLQHLTQEKVQEVAMDFTTLTLKDSPQYDISEGKRLAIVFNQERFLYDLSDRRGTEQDCQSILQTFDKLGFDVQIYDDLKLFQIERVIQKLQAPDQPELACLVIFILTHGEDNGVLHSHDKPYRLDKSIINELLPSNCPALKSKPKLIFVQACQGKQTDPGVEVRVRSRHTSTDGSSSSNYRIPHHSDLLIFQAAYHGHYSFRSKSGSWFIQALCHALDQSSDMDNIHSILIKVKRFVSLYKESNVPGHDELDRKRQIPLVQDTLIRELYLKQRGPNRDYQLNG
ncbi:caspase-1-like isoform X2 [Tigriopus californicus]|nr:caspase-1-like isoform X2 [Tigriopus californicus]